LHGTLKPFKAKTVRIAGKSAERVQIEGLAN
jgi:hypothetical protein